MLLRTLAAVGWLVLLGALAFPGRSFARQLHLGFLDGEITFAAQPALRAAWFDRIASINADRLRVNVPWQKIATQRPDTEAEAADPSWHGYDWAALDAVVRDAAVRGLAPILNIADAPAWVDGPGRPADARPGTWRPDPAALAAFSRALALRYSGHDPSLPAVRYWQVWNEPNLRKYLGPQWSRGRPAAPAHYRRLLNAAYGALKAVDPANVVVTGGTAPFGDPGAGRRMAPARFVRELLCLRGRALKRAPCPDPARFDVLAHHPYSVGGPCRRARNADDVTVPDFGKLIAPLRRAERTGRARGARRHRVWATEVSWDSRPPDPHGVPVARHARWLAEMLFVLARRGVDTLTWLLARDESPTPSYSATYQSGVFLRDGRPKRAARAFAFPFVVSRTCGGPQRLWVRAPSTAAVVVQRHAGRRWRTVTRFAPGAPARVLVRRVRIRRGTRLIARSGRAASLVWTVS